MSTENSTFDPEVFMSTEVTESMATKFDPVDEGEFVASVEAFKVRAVKDAVVLDVLWLILDDALEAKMNMEKIIVRQGVFLDVEHDGRLMTGINKNVRLGRLREALGQNRPGQPWNFRMLKGAGPVKITVTQRASTDPTKPDEIYNDVVKVTPLS